MAHLLQWIEISGLHKVHVKAELGAERVNQLRANQNQGMAARE
jgi:hypothetical protein